MVRKFSSVGCVGQGVRANISASGLKAAPSTTSSGASTTRLSRIKTRWVRLREGRDKGIAGSLIVMHLLFDEQELSECDQEQQREEQHRAGGATSDIEGAE